ncbi:uncharacterized protein LOC132729735 [Ruditapes philippinarum]|uniref:uncharacterized protein LOC132729735 n=1 Tax=Ruditapes philippinarum TaxID=129788 RepID=UPI00295A9493|nr:uncharacterized protein LOC132729735 [Ruditapes philippinarum]XP_060571544.1 uncharacterized protein LOC132729735 [Ruditapes philippinarum]
MEVPGELAGPSDKDLNYFCIPCGIDGLKEQAYGYCQDCEEHLCESCYNHHRRQRPSRNHVLLVKERMLQRPKTGNITKDRITEFCTKHGDKPQEFFCNKHGSTACSVCVTLEHKHCKVDYIPDVSESVSDELDTLINRMETLIKKCKSNVKNAGTETINAEQMYKEVAEAIHQFREEINECLDRMEADIMADAETYARREKCKQENVKEESLHIAEEMKSTMSMLKGLSEENKLNQLFIEMKNAESHVLRLSSKEQQMAKDSKSVGDVKFIRNQNIIDQLRKENVLGTLSTLRNTSADSAACAKTVKSINMRSFIDKEPCSIAGMVMISSTQMIVADISNSKIKMIDVDNEKLVSEISVSSAPRDIIKIPQNKLAVALVNAKHIQIMSFNDTSVALDRYLYVGEESYCIAYCQDKLVVGCNYNPFPFPMSFFFGKLVILDLDGNIIQVFDSLKLYGGPEKITISRDEKFIYVSDYNIMSQFKFLKVDWQGNIVQRFQDKAYKRPVGIQELEDGTLLVCYIDSHNIVRLSSSFKKCRIEGLENTEILHPHAVTYSQSDSKLYISCSSKKGFFGPRDLLKVFSITWV